jgi:hypothetical protein
MLSLNRVANMGRSNQNCATFSRKDYFRKSMHHHNETIFESPVQGKQTTTLEMLGAKKITVK